MAHKQNNVADVQTYVIPSLRTTAMSMIRFEARIQDLKTVMNPTDSEDLRRLIGQVLNDQLEKKEVVVSDRFRAMRVAFFTNLKILNALVVRRLGVSSHTWLDLMFLVECVNDADECIDAHHEELPEFTHIPENLRVVGTLDTNEIILALHHITWLFVDERVPKTDAWLKEIRVYFRALWARARMFCVIPIESDAVWPTHSLETDSLVKQIETQMPAGTYDIRLRVDKNEGVKSKIVKRDVETNMTFIHIVALYGSYIEREFAEATDLNIVDPPDQEITRRIYDLVVATLLVKLDNTRRFAIKSNYERFMAERKLLPCDRAMYWWVQASDNRDQRAINILRTKNGDMVGLPSDFEVSKLFVDEAVTFIDFMFGFFTRSDKHGSYVDAIVGQGWHERPKHGKPKVYWIPSKGTFVAVVDDDWSRVERFKSVMEAFISLRARALIPDTLPHPTERGTDIDMSCFDTIIHAIKYNKSLMLGAEDEEEPPEPRARSNVRSREDDEEWYEERQNRREAEGRVKRRRRPWDDDSGDDDEDESGDSSSGTDEDEDDDEPLPRLQAPPTHRLGDSDDDDDDDY